MTRKEYNNCVQLFADRLFRFAIKKTCDEARARDIVQQSFEKLWLKHEEVNFSKAKAYLFTTAHNFFIDEYRKNKKIQHTAIVPEFQENRYDNFDLKDTLEIALKQLSDIQKTVVLLRDYEGYSYKEIAEICNLSEAQVKVYIFRARKKMQQLLISMGISRKKVVYGN